MGPKSVSRAPGAQAGLSIYDSKTLLPAPPLPAHVPQSWAATLKRGTPKPLANIPWVQPVVKELRGRASLSPAAQNNH